MGFFENVKKKFLVLLSIVAIDFRMDFVKHPVNRQVFIYVEISFIEIVDHEAFIVLVAVEKQLLFGLGCRVHYYFFLQTGILKTTNPTKLINPLTPKAKFCCVPR